MRAARVSRLVAFLAGITACAGFAAPLGTLFHTPQERERLDRLRRGEVVAPAAAGASEPMRQREITGYVKRSDGRGTAFIDGVPVPVDAKGAPLLQPDKVPAYAGRTSENLKIERRDTR
jgi:hypothetical protein